MSKNDIILFSFTYHGWKFSLPIKFNTHVADERETIIDMLNLELNYICKDIDISPIEAEQAKELLSGKLDKTILFNFYSFYTPIWEPITFRKGVHLYKKNLIVDERGALYQKTAYQNLIAQVEEVGKGLKLDEINLEIDVVIPERVISIISSETDLMTRDVHRLNTEGKRFSRKPGEPFLTEFDPIDTSNYHGAASDFYIDDSQAASITVTGQDLAEDKKEKVLDFLNKSGHSVNDLSISDEKSESAAFKYIMIERYECLPDKISQSF